jgi:dienelactone hydrolase
VILRRTLIGAALALSFLVPVAVTAASDENESPFIFSQSELAPAPARGWVVLLPGENELGFSEIEQHYQETAHLLNAHGFDTLIVPYQEAYDEDLDGDPDGNGERVAATTLRAVTWMHKARSIPEDAPGAVIAWGEGAQGLWALATTGSKYPIVNLVVAAAFYPAINEAVPFNSRLPVLVQVGAEDEASKALSGYLAARAPGGVEPELVVHDGAYRAFDVERFVKPKTVRSVPLIGPSITLAYNAAAANAAEQKMLAFLKARLEAPE